MSFRSQFFLLASFMCCILLAFLGTGRCHCSVFLAALFRAMSPPPPLSDLLLHSAFFLCGLKWNVVSRLRADEVLLFRPVYCTVGSDWRVPTPASYALPTNRAKPASRPFGVFLVIVFYFIPNYRRRYLVALLLTRDINPRLAVRFESSYIHVHNAIALS